MPPLSVACITAAAAIFHAAADITLVEDTMEAEATTAAGIMAAEDTMVVGAVIAAAGAGAV
jgi:hypothetical protein